VNDACDTSGDVFGLWRNRCSVDNLSDTLGTDCSGCTYRLLALLNELVHAAEVSLTTRTVEPGRHGAKDDS
jgi:hypothetical protein